MVNHSYECPKCNHQFDKIVEWDQRYAKCPECGKRAERSWQQRKARRFSEPVVLYKYADGQWGVPGRTDSPTPKDADRIECWNMADYERALHKMNEADRQRLQRNHDYSEQLREQQMEKTREEIKYRLARADNAWEKEMLQITLERADQKGYRPFQYQELYSEALQ